MTESEYGLFLSIAAYLCAAGAFLNLFKIKRRGNGALILSAAFLMLGLELWLMKSHAAQGLITLVGVVFVGLLIADVFFRSKQQERQP